MRTVHQSYLACRLWCIGSACMYDVGSTVVRILPRHLRELTQPAEIRAVHETLVGTPALLANIAFLEILKQWPLFGAIQFEVSVSITIYLLLQALPFVITRC